jgi:hypothetical protein
MAAVLGVVVVIVCQDGRAVLAHPWQVVTLTEFLLGDHEVSLFITGSASYY